MEPEGMSRRIGTLRAIAERHGTASMRRSGRQHAFGTTGSIQRRRYVAGKLSRKESRRPAPPPQSAWQQRTGLRIKRPKSTGGSQRDAFNFRFAPAKVVARVGQHVRIDHPSYQAVYGKYHPAFEAFKTAISTCINPAPTQHSTELHCLLTLRFQTFEASIAA